MKTPRISGRWMAVLACSLIACADVAANAKAPTEDSRIEVNWTNPTDFADARQNPPGSSIGRTSPQEWLGDLAKYLQRRGERVLAPGQRLDVTFTDVKRAGTYEPWRGPQWDDIRVIKDIYPPLIDLRFKLTDASGSTLRDGERKLRDPAFLSRGTLNQDDPLRFEKHMLDDWLRREFPLAGAHRD
jgi:hypothetical protein